MPDPFAPASSVPAILTAGTFWAWRADGLVDNPAGHSLAYVFRREDGAAGALTLDAVADGSGFLVEAPGATTAALAPGAWTWAAEITRDSDGAAVVVATGRTDLRANPSAGQADTRTANRRILEAITARLEGRVTTDAESFTIEGRTITRTPLDVLEKMRARYARAVAREEGRGGVRWSFATMR